MQVLKETKEKGISLRTTSYLMVIISVIIACGTFVYWNTCIPELQGYGKVDG